MSDIEATIQHVERLYEAITGEQAPPASREPWAVIPPERDPRQYVEEQLDRLQKLLGAGLEGIANVPPWVPTMSMWETPDTYLVLVDVPGVPQSSLSVTVGRNALEVSGVRPPPTANGSGPLSLRVMERREGPFRRQITLPQSADPDAIHAELHDGVLVLRMEKMERGVRKVEVR